MTFYILRDNKLKYLVKYIENVIMKIDWLDSFHSLDIPSNISFQFDNYCGAYVFPPIPGNMNGLFHLTLLVSILRQLFGIILIIQHWLLMKDFLIIYVILFNGKKMEKDVNFDFEKNRKGVIH